MLQTGTNLPPDPEELQALIDAYRHYVTSVVARHGGVIKDARGREVIAFFGYPMAQEHVVERALHAALALAVPRPLASSDCEIPPGGDGEEILPNGLAVRVGAATGLVIAGSAGEVLGETPGEATRLLSLAEPGQVIIAARTRRLSGSLFAYRDIGPVITKGVADQVQAFQVLGPSAIGSRSEALYSGMLTALVGREEELSRLLRAWEQTKAGRARLVLVSGEPGIGKSRLLAAVQAELAAEPHVCLRYFCSPLHQDSALHPVIARFEREAGFAPADTAEERLRKLEAVLAPAELPPEEIALIAALLAVPTDARYPSPDLTPQRRKERTLAALYHRLEGMARRRPVLMLFEDGHWADPSSLEFLDGLVERLGKLPILLAISFRPEFAAPWIGHPDVSVITMNRMNRQQSATLALQVTAERGGLTAALLDRIITQADGVPLFIEELTKEVLESSEGYDGATPLLSVPGTLHALLMARLDRLSAGKQVAQVGAAIGREFQFRLVEAVADLPKAQLAQGLNQLVVSGLVLRRGSSPNSSYIFKHALVQDAAYGTLLRSRRQALHTRIAATLEGRFPEIVLAQPALLAQHCAEAGLAEKAVSYWLKAGQQAMDRSAMTEAFAQLRKGLDVLAGLPDGPSRQEQELDLQTALGWALTATKGYSVPEVEETLARARTLAQQLDRPEHLVPLIFGQFWFHNGRSEHRLALPLAGQLEQIGEMRNDAALLGHFTHGACRLSLGEFVAARAVLQRCVGLADPGHFTTELLSVDPYLAMLTWLALALACLGYIDQARSRMDEALSEARRLRHVHTLALMFCMASWLDWLTRSPMVHTEEVLALTAEHGFPYFLSWARAYHGQSLIALGQAEEGLALVKQGSAELRAAGAVLNTPMRLASLAEGCAMRGQRAEGLNCLAEAAQFVETTEERIHEAELHRIRGDLLNATSDRAAAEQHYRQAIAVAERQSAKLFQLRASVSLARLWRDQGKRAEARDLLGPIYNWFTEGFDAPDLKDAKALLEQLTP